MKSLWLYLLAALLVTSTGIALATQHQGAPDIVINGGIQGDVPFPHLKHQQNLGDCDACHNLFAKEPGIIDKLKAEGNLRRKGPVMNQCTRCHRQTSRKGLPSGPRTCRKCHQKNKG